MKGSAEQRSQHVRPQNVTARTVAFHEPRKDEAAESARQSDHQSREDGPEYEIVSIEEVRIEGAEQTAAGQEPYEVHGE
jgi:hypothetical protein